MTMPAESALEAQTLEKMSITINQEIHVQAPLDVTFAALLEQLGPGNETPDGKSLNMKIEPWPGGRWYRDLGGPLFASFPFLSNVQYRLKEEPGGTLISFRHSAFGMLTDDQRAGMNEGWSSMHERVRRHAEQK
jgi:hypothetical protein